MNCRHCRTPLRQTFLDLGFAPPSNAYLTESDLQRPELYYPLKIKVCEQCWLVQTVDYASAEQLFNAEYAYFSSTSTTWLEHASRYAEKTINELGLDADSHVVEVACNDGYLLKNFIAAGIPCLGIEPTASTAAVAERLGIPVLRKFFNEVLGKQLAAQGRQADLVVGNNVYAHVPDINDFTRGLKAILKPGGTITLEFPHLLQLITQTQFDTVYHEHFSYLSLFTVMHIFEAAGLRVWNVETLPTHGGSLRIYGCHWEDVRVISYSVDEMLKEEVRQGLQCLAPFQDFQDKADKVKNDLMAFLIEQKRAANRVVGYGAAAKGNTLLNYAGVKPDLLPCIYDAAPAKQNRFMPGSHIPIQAPERMLDVCPDFVLILPWNIATEVYRQYANLEKEGTRFVLAVPELMIL